MEDFTTMALPRGALDPDKRVAYPLGLVLGVDEFEQEHFFLEERDRQHNRALHGYGTVCGLHVYNQGTKIIVEPGLAISPTGKVIRVSRAQCADLDEWLQVAGNRTALEGHLGSPVGSPPNGYALHVVLCYRECETNPVPVPGAPCRSEDDNLAASRITQTFELKLSLNPPPAEEEHRVRRFGEEILQRIEITPLVGPGVGLTEAQMIELVRTLKSSTSPIGSPPSSGPLLLHPDNAEAVLRAGFRVWVTEVRPALLKDCKDCGGLWPDDCSHCPDENPEQDCDCVLLARLSFDLTSGGQVGPLGAPDVQVIEDDRPYLVHTRLLQEWLLHSLGGVSSFIPGSPIEPPLPMLAGEVTGPTHATRVAQLEGADVATLPLGDLPTPGQVLMVNVGGDWQATDLPSAPPVNLAGEVTGPTNATRVAQLEGADVVTLPPGASPTPGQVLMVNAGGDWQATDLPSAPPVNLAGEVTGPTNANRVAKLQTLDVQAAAPAAATDGDVLTLKPTGTGGALEWQAVALPPVPGQINLAGEVTGPINATRVAQIQGAGVVTSPPASPPQSQDIFTVNQAGEWQATPDRHVEIPANLPRYAIVAAGILSVNSIREPTFNELKLSLRGSPPASGLLLVSFQGYQRPSQDPANNQWSHHYIVKVLPVLRDNALVTVAFLDYEDNGLLLLVMNQGQHIPGDALGNVELMIEISRYPFEG